MIVDSKGREVRGRLGKAERCQYAKRMKEAETTRALKDTDQVSRDSARFRQVVQRQLEAAGLRNKKEAA